MTLTRYARNRLSRDSRRILDHLGRYRLLPAADVVRLRGLEDARRARTAIKRLLRAELIGGDTLHGDETYYYLTVAGARLLADADSFPTHWPGPIPEKAKLINYAILAFCLQGQTARHRLTRLDLERHLPELRGHRFPLNYYVDLNDRKSRLGFVRVDTGGHGRWDRIVAKARDDWRDHESQACFRPLVAQGQFEVALLTALPQKAARIRDAIAAENRPMSIRVCAVPQLLPILQPELLHFRIPQE